MEGFEIRVNEPDGMTWRQLQEVVNGLSQERIGDAVKMWKMPEDGGYEQADDEIDCFIPTMAMIATEDHVNPSGDGSAPVSLYPDEEFTEADIVIKKGALVIVH